MLTLFKNDAYNKIDIISITKNCFNDMDKDNSGTISYKEFNDWYY
ncbi:MAG: EF-hand domain-containing protein [bacterium]